MPGPTTEVLNDDMRQIRGSLDALKGEVHQLDVGLARLQTEFGLAKWLLGLTLVATLSGIGTGIWWAATLTAEVQHLAGIVQAGKAAPSPSLTPKAN